MKVRPARTNHKKGNIATGKNNFVLEKFHYFASFSCSYYKSMTANYPSNDRIRTHSTCNMSMEKRCSEWKSEMEPHRKHGHGIEHSIEGMKVFQQYKLGSVKINTKCCISKHLHTSLLREEASLTHVQNSMTNLYIFDAIRDSVGMIWMESAFCTKKAILYRKEKTTLNLSNFEEQM